MSNPTVTPSVPDQAVQGDAFDRLENTAQPRTPPSTPSGLDQAVVQHGDAFDQLPDDTPKATTTNDPRKTGEIVNDVGQKVIVPKDGEDFADTLKRAIAYHNSLTPEQRQAAINAETKTMPKKVAQTLGGAATIGTVGPALLAAPGEIAEAVPSVLTHTIDGVKAIGAWASKNPVQAYMLYQVMKELVPGAKKSIGIIKGMPEPE